MDPSKLRIPAGALRVEIDDPPDRCLTKPSGVIYGWFATLDYETPEEFQFRVGPITLSHTLIKRPDVEGAMPGHSIAGFQIRFDLANYLYYIDDNRLAIRLTVPGYDPFALRFTIKEGVLASCIAAASGV